MRVKEIDPCPVDSIVIIVFLTSNEVQNPSHNHWPIDPRKQSQDFIYELRRMGVMCWYINANVEGMVNRVSDARHD